MKAQQPSIHDQVERFSILVRRSLAFWRRALVVFVVGSILAAIFVFTRPRAYRSETVIQYQETIRSTDIANGESSSENARRTGARLREVLLSRATLEPIIKDLQLYKRSLDRGNLIEAVDEMRKNITFRAREGDTFEIAFVGTTPQEAQEVTRRLGECIIEEAATRRAEHAKTLKEFLAAESERNHADLRQKEAALAAFTAAHPVLVARLQQPGGGGIVTPTPSSSAPAAPSDPVLAALEARAYRIERQLRAGAKDQPPPPPRPTATFQPPPDSPELVAARRDLADKLARFTEKHPDVAAARARLRAAEAAQEAANQAALEAFNAQQAAARAQEDPPPPKNATDEAALRKELADLQAQIAARRASSPASPTNVDAAAPAGSDVALAVEFRRLEREVNEGRERQRQLDDKLFRASITASSVMNDRNIQVSVLDPAFLPMAPVSKPRSLMLAGLLALCLVLGIATAAASTVLDDRIYDRMDLERLDVLPVLGTIPRAKELPPKS